METTFKKYPRTIKNRFTSNLINLFILLNPRTPLQSLKPLQKKLKKDIEYNYDEKDKKQVQKIKLLCRELPKLQFPDENRKFIYIVEADASEYSYGGVLCSLYKCLLA